MGRTSPLAAVPALPMTGEGEIRLRLFPVLSTRVGSLRSPVRSKSSERNSISSARGSKVVPYRAALIADLRLTSTALSGKDGTTSTKSPVKSNSSLRPAKFMAAEPLAGSVTLPLLSVARFGKTGAVAWVGEFSGGGLDEVRSITSFAIFRAARTSGNATAEAQIEVLNSKAAHKQTAQSSRLHNAFS